MSPALEGLLGHDQTSAHPQRRFALPVHHLPGVLPQLVHHAEAHEGPQARGHPARLEDREDLSVPVLRVIEAEPRVGLGLGSGSGVGELKNGMHGGSKKGGMFTFSAAGLGKAKLKRDRTRGGKNVLKYGGVVML